MNWKKYQHCIRCDKETGRCSEDTICCEECGVEPLCEDCWSSHRHNSASYYHSRLLGCECIGHHAPCAYCTESWEEL